MLRILIAHTQYQQQGGEDKVVEAESDLLQQHGHDVQLYLDDNKRIDQISRLRLAARTVWSREAQKCLSLLAVRFQPDIIHVHNTFPLMSPSIYWAAAQMNIPVVQTLHNFRLLCPQAMLLRDNKICEDCIGHPPWRSIRYKCYRGSSLQSAVITGMLGIHRLAGTYTDKISAYITLSNFSKSKFIAGGLPANKIYVKPNFVDIKDHKAGTRSNGLFVGRLSPEKGLICLTEAMKRLNGIRLDIIGTGDLSNKLVAHRQLKLHGWKTTSQVHDAMRSASYLVMPSICYEGLPVTLIEAFANGLPVIASRIGALAELVKDGHTGLLFDAGSTDSLVEKIAWAEAHPGELMAMGRNARAEYERKYLPATNYDLLIRIYENVLAQPAPQ